MSDEQSTIDLVHRMYLEAAQKFDYFVTGGAGVALAFSLEKFDPGALPHWQFLAPVSWFFLLSALASGLIHLRHTVSGLHTNSAQLQKAGERRQLRAAMTAAGSGGVESADTGEFLTRQAAEARIRSIDLDIAGTITATGMLRAYVNGWWKARNATLALGFLALALWKSLNLNF